MHSIWSTALISGTTTTIQQEAISHYKTWHRTVFGREQLTKKTTLNLAANVDRMFFFLRRLQSLIQSITNSIKQHSRRLSATSRSVVAYAFADRRLECTLRKTRRKEATDDKCSVSQSRSTHWLLAKADYRSAPIADLRKKVWTANSSDDGLRSAALEPFSIYWDTGRQGAAPHVLRLKRTGLSSGLNAVQQAHECKYQTESLRVSSKRLNSVTSSRSHRWVSWLVVS